MRPRAIDLVIPRDHRIAAALGADPCDASTKTRKHA